MEYGNNNYVDNNKKLFTILRFEPEMGPWEFRGEFVDYELSNEIGAGLDGNANGYYLKVFKQISPTTRLMLHYDVAKMGNKALGEEYITITPGLIINVSDETYLLMQYDMADWKTTFLEEWFEHNVV
ncbi:MAG: hypothetical protein QGH40_08290 [bacterium]|jgi:hypothetical protein|nr:hypothetical protein [bacterium]